ncbi:interleukin 21 receptor, tandem duplicate 1 isoform X1 [Syngnathus scovelli]|uniref:interleukin 21 receptor, tandem duplicate 1 isoform X1 n=1 Tax=Syngnathus scovelli TaxID=161590 RepID=UPI00210F3C7E|nr:interleukin 21 receptor, tandem duplicate 1 isoform X3 [Syngnathus scovelli]
MAAVLSLMLWSLPMLLEGVNSPTCGVTCSTDYNVLLNCSCASVPTQPLRLDVNCSGDIMCRHSSARFCSDGELHVADSCWLMPPESWCVMYPPELYHIAAIGTECTATVSLPGDPYCELSDWALYDVVKPPPPFNVRVTCLDGFDNITWDLANDNNDCLMYELRIRTQRGLMQDPARFFSVDKRFFLVGHKELPPRAKCSVVVRTKLCPSNPSQGPWSEWSSTTKWTNAPTNAPTKSASVAVKGFWLYVFLAVLVLLGGLLLVYSQIPFLLKRFPLSSYVCRPHDFFQPLYLDYGGNFKGWVRPLFSEHDILGNTPHEEMAPTTKKQLYFHKAATKGDDETRPAGCLLLVPAPLAQLTHVSIHSVIVCEEDDQQASDPNHRELLDSDPEEAVVDGQDQGRLFNDWPEEAERASLASNRQSDDGYPRMDMDTVDSGFGECTSPSHSGSGEPARNFLPERRNSRSNYVKQWMMCNDAREDSRNALQ